MTRRNISPQPPDAPTSAPGILAGAQRLEPWLHATMVLLSLASAVRYTAVHGWDARTALVMAGATVLMLQYAAMFRVERLRLRWAPAWTLLLVATWATLALFAPSFAWVAVPLAFLVLQKLPYRPAVVVLVAMMLTVVLGWTNMVGTLDPTIILGPLSIAILALVTYRALERESNARQALLEDLREAQADLADAEHRAGAIAERARLSREIHDSLAQSLTSINLLLQAAEKRWEANPQTAREDVRRAAVAAREGLTEVRRVVQDLAPEELGEDGAHAGLEVMLDQTCARALAGTSLAYEVRVHGEPHRLEPQAGAALLRSTRGLLANVVEHADATRVFVSVTYQPDGISVDVRDDGRGFDPSRLAPSGGRGHGIPGIRSRVRQFGGQVSVESAAWDRHDGGSMATSGGDEMSADVREIRVVLVDDHAVVRSGLRALLDTEPDLVVVGEAGDRDAAMSIVARMRPDVVLMDLNLGSGPGGAATTGDLLALEQPPRVLVLTTYDTEADILAAIDAGASGYLLKDAPPDEVFRAVRATAQGQTALAPSVAAALVKRASNPGPLLTAREVQVVELLASGASNSDMAGELLISVATVKAHLTHIYDKLGVDTRAGAVARAIELRIIRA